jgi:hypothetical protein
MFVFQQMGAVERHESLEIVGPIASNYKKYPHCTRVQVLIVKYSLDSQLSSRLDTATTYHTRRGATRGGFDAGWRPQEKAP